MLMKQLGFWSLLSISIGSQIGSGIFLLPSSLASFGWYGIYGTILAGLSAVLLSFIFARLCILSSQSGGPHVYIAGIFGRRAAFFVGWSYWLLSWISSCVLVMSGVEYLSPLLPDWPGFSLFCELMSLLIITYINTLDIKTSACLEIILSAIKFLPLVLLPLYAMDFFHAENISSSAVAAQNPSSALVQSLLIAFWGFIGLECAIAPSEAVDNSSVTIPRAMIIGTMLVAVVYVLNNVVMMGCVPADVLANQVASYLVFAEKMCGHFGLMVMGVLGFLFCIGTLNAWTFITGQIALSLTSEGYLPEWFSRKNSYGAPHVVLYGVCACMSLLLIITRVYDEAHRIKEMIELSVSGFVIIYCLCACAYYRMSTYYMEKCVALCGIAICIIILSSMTWMHVLMLACMLVSGAIVYAFTKSRRLK